jgi:hypothetical protein
MPIPNLSGFGVLPPGRHDCTLDEIESVYAFNSHRQSLWHDFQGFVAWAKKFPAPACVLIDGGFTSDKAAPKDIDVVFDLDGCATPAASHWGGVFLTQQAQLKADFRVDFWIYLPAMLTTYVHFSSTCGRRRQLRAE